MKRVGSLAVVAAAAALGGCAGGDDDNDAPRESFAREADAICLGAQVELENVPQPRTISEVRPWAERYVPIARGQVERLRDLEPPQDQAATADAFVEALDRSVDVVEEMGEAAGRGDAARVQQLTAESQAATAEAGALAGELGLQVCAPQPG